MVILSSRVSTTSLQEAGANWIVAYCQFGFCENEAGGMGGLGMAVGAEEGGGGDTQCTHYATPSS